MFRSLLSSLLLCLPVVFATTTSTAAKSIQTVTVGQSGFNFFPDTVTVAPGDQVVFNFVSGNHSVAEAAFGNPCHPLSGTSFFSGFFPSPSSSTPPTFTVTINGTKPIWFYCGQVQHCELGMVGVINPPVTGNTLAQFKAAASNAQGSSTPANVQGGVVGNHMTPSTTGSGTSSPTSSGSSGGSGTSGSTSDAWAPQAWSDMCVVLSLSAVAAAMYLV